MSTQQSIMKFDPATGAERPYPSHAEQWREYHGFATAWLFNPWSGTRRDAGDVGSDVLERLIGDPGSVVDASIVSPPKAASAAAQKVKLSELRGIAKRRDEKAPYGYKADGVTPRAKPGRKVGSRARKTARTTRAK